MSFLNENLVLQSGHSNFLSPVWTTLQSKILSNFKWPSTFAFLSKKCYILTISFIVSPAQISKSLLTEKPQFSDIEKKRGSLILNQTYLFFRISFVERKYDNFRFFRVIKHFFIAKNFAFFAKKINAKFHETEKHFCNFLGNCPIFFPFELLFAKK